MSTNLKLAKHLIRKSFQGNLPITLQKKIFYDYSEINALMPINKIINK